MLKWVLAIILLPLYFGTQVMQQSVARQTEDTMRILQPQLDPQKSPIIEIFNKVEHEVKSNRVTELGKNLASIVSITIGSSEHGYYSVNQALSVLAGYFSDRRPISFEFSRIQTKESAPYATGRFQFVQKGIQESAQVYVSLLRQDSVWVVNQFNIY